MPEGRGAFSPPLNNVAEVRVPIPIKGVSIASDTKNQENMGVGPKLAQLPFGQTTEQNSRCESVLIFAECKPNGIKRQCINGRIVECEKIGLGNEADVAGNCDMIGRGLPNILL